MEQYLKPSLEIVVFDEDETVLTGGGCCSGNHTIRLPEVPNHTIGLPEDL